jgi:outer membrane protein assembly factor BamB
MRRRKRASTILGGCLVAAALLVSGAGAAGFEDNNRFRPGSFPARIDATEFSLPLESGAVLVVLPSGLMSDSARLQKDLAAASGQTLEFRAESTVREADLSARHLIIAGNLQNNRWARHLYLKRLAFADAYFPGAGGVVITPAVSPWNRQKNILVIGFSRDEDGPAAFAEFLRRIGPGAKKIGALRFLKTPLAFPQPPPSVDKTLATITGDLVIFPPYREVFLWGLAYHLTGDAKWAACFRAGCRALYERARKSGAWVPEPWTTLYFDLWRFFIVWGLLDRDPAFGTEDRAVIEELLWNYWRVLDGDGNFPHFRPEVMIPGEIRQNHTTFLALDLFCAYEYYKVKYGMTDLERLRAKFEPAMSAQVKAVHGNDDAGFGYWTNLVFGYIYLAPNHALLYETLQGNESYLAAGQLEKFADLLVTATDNRRDGASFGDVSGYNHRAPGLPRGMTEKYLEIAAAASGDGQFHWVYDWLAHDSGFELNNLFDGEYAIEALTAPPDRFLGVHPVLLDDPARRWAARRAEKKSFIPVEGRRYVDKMSFRRDFDAASEYLLLDGTSTFAHGHQDGNTVVRLTWKDRIWLFDLDYIALTPRYHNGVVVTRNGTQEEPPPLTSLELAEDFREAGLTRTASRDYNGADWLRNIIWKKGKYFVFLDEIRAREAGEYRLDCRWRTRGDTALESGNLTVRQGEKEFRILSADGLPRRLTTEKESYWNTWDYPWGKKELEILRAGETAALEPGDNRLFANLMYASDGAPASPLAFRPLDPSTFLIDGGDGAEIAGLDPAFLAGAGITADAELFLMNSRRLWLAGARFVRAGDVSIQGPARFSVEVDTANRQATLHVSEAAGGEFVFKGCRIDRRNGTPQAENAARPQESPARATASTAETHVRLSAGNYVMKIAAPLPGTSDFLARAAAAPRPRLPSPAAEAFPDFGFLPGAKTELVEPWTAYALDGGTLLFGNGRGEIGRLENGRWRAVWRSPVGRPLGVILAADIDGDKSSEVLAADDAENLFAVSSGGVLLWTAKLTKYMGENANAVDIAAGPAGAGQPVVFVATNGFKLLAFDAQGRLRWESLVRYHKQTRIRVVDNGGKSLAAVGTVYSTPLNVFDASTGRPLWHTWDQMGDEMNSTTDYCGVHLTDMLFLDADSDGSKEIIFGTKYNRVYCLRLKGGATVWEANVGDEVRVVRQFINPASGEARIAAATEAGEIVLLDRLGRRLARAGLPAAVAAMELLPRAGRDRIVLLVATADGKIFAFDETLGRRASLDLGGEVRAIVPLPAGEGADHFLVLSEKTVQSINYINYSIRKSRLY